jgi:hypothetical protein
MTTRKQALQAEAASRRTNLENQRKALKGATERFKFTRHPADGRNVAELAGQIRLAEIALDGTLEALTKVEGPERAHVRSPREELFRQRREITQRLAFRRQQHEQAVAQERQRCGYRNEAHIQQHLRNVFGSGSILRRKTEEQDELQLKNIAEQLAELDRSEATEPTEAA